MRGHWTGTLVVIAFIALLLISSQGIALAQGSAAHMASVKPTFLAFSHWGFNTTYMIAYPGASFLPLTIELLYEGPTTLYYVNVSLNATYPITPVRGQSSIGITALELQPGQEIMMTGLFNVSPQATPGVYNETLNVTYLVEVQTSAGPVLVKGASQVRFPVAIVGFSDVIVNGYRTTPPVIYAGLQAATLTVYISNRGNSPASNVTVFLNLTGLAYPLYPDSNVVHLAYLPPGYVVNITFPLELENVTELRQTAFGYFRVPVPSNIAAYLVVKGIGIDEICPLEIYIAPSAHFVVAKSNYPRITPGSSDFYLTVTLGNAGTADGDFVTVTLLPNPVFTPYVPSSENPVVAMTLWNSSVGNVPAGSESNVTFVLSVSSGVRPGTYVVPLLINWLQPPTMQPMHEVILVPVTVSPSISLSSLSSFISPSELTLYLVVAVVVIIVVVMAAIGRRRA
ncbi:MAG: COG1361 S-layer family protein [Acidilobus sp.]